MLERYDCPELRSIWSEENKYLIWYDIESMFLKQLRNTHHHQISRFRQEWIDKIKQIEEETRHDVAAFVTWMESFLRDTPLVGDEARYVHYGLTSSDITDTAFSIQLKETNGKLSQLRAGVLAAISNLYREHSDMLVLGRTHGRAAETIPFGNKLNAYSRMLKWANLELICYGRLCGSVGDYKYFDANVERLALNELGLLPSPINDGQIMSRLYHANFMNEWALLANAIAKIATDIRLLAHDGVDEVSEKFTSKQMGSSSMPHKQNPILCENLCGLARVINGYQATAMQNIVLWNERDISHSSAERYIFPDAAVTLGFMLRRLQKVLSGLVVHQERIATKVQTTPTDSQAAMLRLIDEGMTRSEAHEKMRGSK